MNELGRSENCQASTCWSSRPVVSHSLISLRIALDELPFAIHVGRQRLLSYEEVEISAGRWIGPGVGRSQDAGRVWFRTGTSERDLAAAAAAGAAGAGTGTVASSTTGLLLGGAIVVGGTAGGLAAGGVFNNGNGHGPKKSEKH